MDRPIELFISGDVVDFIQNTAVTFIFDGEEICETCSCSIPRIGDAIELTTKVGRKIHARVARIEWDVLEFGNSFGARIYLDRPVRPSEQSIPSLRGGVENLFAQYPPIDVVEQLSQTLSRFRDVPTEVVDLLDRAARVLEGYSDDEEIETETLTLNYRQRQWLHNRLDEEILFFRQLDDRNGEESMLMGDLVKLQKTLTSDFPNQSPQHT